MTTADVSYNLAGSVRHQGLPVAGVMVSAYEVAPKQDQVKQNLRVAWQKTGTKGEYSLAVKGGTYRLEIRSSGNRFLNQSLTEVVVMANTTCNISLSTGYTLTGNVFTNNGAKILAGTIIAQAIESSFYSSIGAIESGLFRLVLPRNDYRLAYRPLPLDDFTQATTGTDYSPERQYFITPAYLATDITVLPVWQDSKVEIILPQLVSLQGIILDHKNTRVSDATVTVKPSELLGSTIFSELGLAAKCKSDAQGNFQLFLQAGAYDFTINPTESSSLFTFHEERISIYENCNRQFQLKDGCRIEGKVLHNGDFIPSCSVAVFDSADQLNLILNTDDKGNFQTVLPKGRYKILASVNGQTTKVNGNQVLAPTISEIVVAGKTFITMDLQKGALISGKVVDESRRPRTGISVCALLNKLRINNEDKDNDRKPGLVLNRDITDGEGNYGLHLAPGNYSLVVNNDFANAKFVEITSDLLELDFILAGWRQLSLEIVGEDGHKISNCRLGYAPYAINNAFPEMQKYENVFDSQLTRGTLFSGSDGVVQIVLPSGVYTLEVTPPKDSSYDGKLIRQLSLSNDSHRKVTLPLKNSLTSSNEELRLV